MGLRDRLRERQPPRATVALRIDGSAEAEENERRLVRLRDMLEAAQERGDTHTVAALSAELTERVAKAEAAYEFVTVKAITPVEMEELLAEHPPTDEQRTADPHVGFDKTTFYPALLAACCETDETEEDWADIISSGDMVLGEITTLVNVALDLNDRSPSVSLGKGSTPTRS